MLDDTQGDEDFNDLAVLVGGCSIKPNTITILRHVEKRYMAEDLGTGNASDIDFNDIVVDVNTDDVIIDYAEYLPYYQGLLANLEINTAADNVFNTVVKHFSAAKILFPIKGLEITRANDEGHMPIDIQHYNQKAKIYAMGGTLKFGLFFGNGNVRSKWYKAFEKEEYFDYTQMLNTAANAVNYGKVLHETDMTENNPWDADKNNIHIVVYPDNTNEGVASPQWPEWELDFPVNGTIPSIIAVDPIEKWNWERVSVFTPRNEAIGAFLELQRMAKEASEN